MAKKIKPEKEMVLLLEDILWATIWSDDYNTLEMWEQVNRRREARGLPPLPNGEGWPGNGGHGARSL